MKIKQIKRNFKKMDAASRAFIKGASATLIFQVLMFILHPTFVEFNRIIYIFAMIVMFVFKEKSARMDRYKYYLKGRMREWYRRPIITMFLN